MKRLAGLAALLLAAAMSLALSACGGGGGSTITPPPPTKTTPTVTVTPTPSSITTAQSLSVTITVSGGSGNPTPTGSVTLSSTGYTSSPTTLTSGSASITVAAGALAAGTDTLTANYTPDTSGSATYNSASGAGSVTVTSPSKTTPTVTVTPTPASITTAQSLSVTVSVNGGSGNPTPTGSVTLSSGSYTSTATTLSSGSANITVTANTLHAGTDTLTASYTPDNSGSATYNSASGAGSVTVTALATPTMTVTPASSNISTSQSLSVAVTVNSSGSYPTPSGSVKLTSGAYTSSSVTLSGGSGTINIPGGSLPTGTDTLTVTYTPDSSGSAYYNSNSKTASVTVGTLLTPTVTVMPTAPVVSSEPTVTVDQSLSVTVVVSGGSGNPTPTGSVTLSGPTSSGTYTSSATTLSGGSASIVIPAGQLANSTDTLTATYTPDSNSLGTYITNTGNATVAVVPLSFATVTVSPDSTSITTAQSLQVTVTVSGQLGTPTGTVKLSSGGYTSSSTTLSGGAATIVIPAGGLTVGSDTLTAKYTPDSTSSVIYNNLGQGSSSAITVTLMTTVAVNQTPTAVAVYNQLMGMNMAVWYDPTTTGVLSALQAAGITALRWPGGSTSDNYHWQTNTGCNGAYANGNATFANFLNDLAIPGNFDVALTADYGTDPTCTTGGLPSEAANWVTAALNNAGGKVTVSHVTVGNEEYGGWEEDMHTLPHDPTTYADAVAGSTGYYQSIKTASPKTLVGVDVNPGNSPAWDPIVLANAPYDFVEYHFYLFNPGNENDTTLIYDAAQIFTTNINTVKSELKTAGKPNTPIYAGEVGSVSSNPGKQSWSITQGLYAGQLLGEAMNDGVSRLTWWIGLGNCNGTLASTTASGDPANFSSSLYGWQTFGAYNVFSDGPSDTNCPNAGPLGTMSPTAVAFQLFSQVAVNGESVLTPTVAGDQSNVRAYAATHSGGTALVLFNLNETTSEPVTISLSNETTSSPDVKVTTYNKALYDQTNANPAVWATPTTTDMGTQSLPLTLKLTPWSMNVIIIQ